jgi:hypothetical protein
VRVVLEWNEGERGEEREEERSKPSKSMKKSKKVLFSALNSKPTIRI